MEFRQEMSEFVRSFALNQFNKQFKTVSSQADIEVKIAQNIHAVQEIYRPRRYYKRKSAPPTDIESRVQVTLLEYDYRGGEIQGTTGGDTSGGVLEKQQTQEVQKFVIVFFCLKFLCYFIKIFMFSLLHFTGFFCMVVVFMCFLCSSKCNSF